MSAMVVKQRRSQQDFIPCENGCRSGSGPQRSTDLGRAVATWSVLILGRKVMLCTRCARNWRRWWAEALGDGEEAEAA